MSYEARVWAKAQPIKMTDGKCVLIALADCLNSETGACFPSQKTLAFEIGTTERTISEHLSRLEKAGYIKRFQRHRSNGTRTSDRYDLMMDAQISEQENPPPIEAKDHAEDFSSSKSLPEDFSPSPPEDFARPPEDFAQPPEDFARPPEDSSPLELEVLNYNYEPKYEQEEVTSTCFSFSKHSKTKEKNALDAFVNIWHKHKVPLWTEIQVLTQRRQSLLNKVISDAGSFDSALDIFSSAIQEAALTDWFKNKKLSLENIMSNDKLIGLAERFKQRQDLPDEGDISTWTEVDYLNNWGTIPENINWGSRA